MADEAKKYWSGDRYAIVSVTLRSSFWKTSTQKVERPFTLDTESTKLIEVKVLGGDFMSSGRCFLI